MAKKWPGEWPQPHEFSQLYREKKARIQEMGHSEFIEFLNWIENVNKWKNKEEWKRIVDQVFNKYSDNEIISVFNRFRDFKKEKPEWYKYEKILDEAKGPLRVEIFGDNIVKRLLGRYGNYLKLLKRKRLEAEREEIEEVIQGRIKETLDAWAENHYCGNDRDIVEWWDIIFNPEYEYVPVGDPEVSEDENNTVINDENGQRKEPRQLEIPFEDSE